MRALLASSLAVLCLAAAPPARLDATIEQEGTQEAVEQEAAAVAEAPVAVPVADERALRYYRGGMKLWALSLLWGLAFPALILFGGFSAKIRDAARRIAPGWWLTAGVFALFYFSLQYLANLPIDFYTGYVRQHAYELSNKSLGSWFSDSLKAGLLLLLFVFIIVPGAYFFLRVSKKLWWLFTTIAAAVTMVFILLIHPIWVAPLFDDFGPMNDKSLEAEILALADRAGIEGGRVYEVNKSEDTNTVNAYVSGAFGTKRIVLWDTIIEKLDRRQLLFAMGHEMGHYVLGHLWKFLLTFSLVLLAALYTAHRVVNTLIERYRNRFGFDRVDDPASLPLLILLVGIFTLVVSPIQLSVSRYFEREADRFGLEITRDNHAAATTWLVLQKTNLSNPNPGFVYRVWRASHPVLADRIGFANEYRPWESEGPLRYEGYFKD